MPNRNRVRELTIFTGNNVHHITIRYVGQVVIERNSMVVKVKAELNGDEIMINCPPDAIVQVSTIYE